MTTVNNDTIQGRLQQSFRDHAAHVAISCNNQDTSYAELDKLSSSISGHLIEQQVPSLAFVGISIGNRKDFIASVIGTLRSRCIFVPLDPKLPASRLQVMIKSLDLKYIITDDTTWSQVYDNELFSHLSFYLVNRMGKERKLIPPVSDSIMPADPLYVYFTSGSTGEPKAVLGKNESLLHFINWEIETLKVNHTWKVSQFINTGFDACLRDIFVPLLAGGTICIMEEIDKNVYEADLTKWIDKNKINLIHCVPSFFKLINNDGISAENYQSLKYVLLSGEALQIPILEKWYNKMGAAVKLVNLYGTTETTLVKTYYFIQPEDTARKAIPAGRPISNTEILILNDNMMPCGIDETGDVYINTPFMTHGYYNDKKANKEKFISYTNTATVISTTLYQTGDTGKWLADGNLLVLGRKDRQVKIRGIRIEPGEIEKTILKHPAVKEAVVVVRKDKNDEPILVVYYTGEKQASMEILHEYMASLLPPYMAPHYFIFLENIPLTPNGKTDVKALPDPFAQVQYAAVAARDHQEEMLVEIWAQILNINKRAIGITDNFFFLEGNSIQVLQLLSKILETFNLRLPLEAFLKQPTIVGCIEYFKKEKTGQENRLVAAPMQDDYTLSYGQARIFRECNGRTDTNFNMPNVIEIDGHIDPVFLESVFVQLISRHEVLRTSFHLVNGNPRQVVHIRVPFNIHYRKCTPETLQADIRSCIQPFNLQTAPLMRVSLLEVSPVKQVLVIDIHHIIIDALSGRILERELIGLLQQKQLQPVALHYKDFAEWQQQIPQQLARKKQEQYWLNRFNDPAPPLLLPLDHDRPAEKNYNGAIYKFFYNKDQVRALAAYARKKEVTLFTVLLACYYVLLHKLSGSEDIVVGIPASGRSHPAAADIMGLFVGELALRSKINSPSGFSSFLKQLNEDVIAAFENQDFQYRELKEKLQPSTEPGRNALFDVWFAFQQVTQSQIKISESTTFIKQINNNTVALFDLLLRAYETDEEIQFRFEYCTKLFTRETIENFAGHYEAILQQVINDDQVEIGNIDIMLSEKEIVVE